MHLLEAMGQLDPLHNDDQVRLNLAIEAVTGVDWRNQFTYGVTVGSLRSSSLQFKMAVLPYSVVCRSMFSKLLSSRLVHLWFWALDEEKMEEVDSQMAEMWVIGVCTIE